MYERGQKGKGGEDVDLCQNSNPKLDSWWCYLCRSTKVLTHIHKPPPSHPGGRIFIKKPWSAFTSQKKKRAVSPIILCNPRRRKSMVIN